MTNIVKNYVQQSLSFEWNSIRLGGSAHGIVTKTVHKDLPGGDRDQGVGGGFGGVGGQGVLGVQGLWGSRGSGGHGMVGPRGGGGLGVVGVQGVVGSRGGVVQGTGGQWGGGYDIIMASCFN